MYYPERTSHNQIHHIFIALPGSLSAHISPTRVKYLFGPSRVEIHTALLFCCYTYITIMI